MPIFEVEMPDGTIYEVDAPAGTPQEQIFAFVGEQAGTEAPAPAEDLPQKEQSFISFDTSRINFPSFFGGGEQADQEDPTPPAPKENIFMGLLKVAGAPQEAVSRTLAHQLYEGGDGIVTPQDVLSGEADAVTRYTGLSDAIFENEIDQTDLPESVKATLGTGVFILDTILTDPINAMTAGGATAARQLSRATEGVDRIKDALKPLSDRAVQEKLLENAAEAVTRGKGTDEAIEEASKVAEDLVGNPKEQAILNSQREGEVYDIMNSRQHALNPEAKSQVILDANIPAALQARHLAAKKVGDAIEAGTSPKLTREARARAEQGYLDGLNSEYAAARAIDDTVSKRVAPAPMKEAKITAEVAAANSISRRAKDAYRAAESKVSYFTQPAIDRIRKINPFVARRVRNLTYKISANTTRDVRMVQSLYKKLPKNKVAAFDQAGRNGNRAVMDEIADAAGATAELKAVRQRLAELAKTRLEYDKNFEELEDFMPRVVRNIRGLRRQLGRSESDFAKARDAIMKQKGVKYLDQQDEAELIDELLRGRGRFLKRGARRTVHEVPEDLAKHYDSGQNSLMSYIHRENETNAIREFTGAMVGKRNEEIGKDLSSTIGDAVAALRDKGMMTTKDGMDYTDEMVSLLQGILFKGRVPPNEAVRAAKQWVHVSSIGFNPGSTIAQIADAVVAMRHMGPYNYIKGLLKSDLQEDVYEAGLRNLAHDLRTAPKASLENLEKKGLIWTGFDWADKKFGSAASRASWFKFKKMSDKKFDKLYKADYTPQELTQIKRELSGEVPVTDLSRSHVFADVAEIRPVSREDMPLAWQEHPNGRALYALLSWSLKQANFAKKQILGQLNGGGVKGKLAGIAGLTLMSAGMSMSGVPRTVFHQWLKGEEFDPTSDMGKNAFAYGVFAKSLVDGANRGNLAEAMLPMAGILSSQIGGVVKAVDGDLDQLSKSMSFTRLMRYLFTDGDQFDLKKVGLPVAAGAAIADTVSDLIPQPVDNEVDAGSIEQQNQIFETALMRVENAQQVGRDPETGLWTPHESIEGGNPTIGFGHKLSDVEVRSGVFSRGISDKAVANLFKADLAKARKEVKRKVPGWDKLPTKYKNVIANIQFNTGSFSPSGWPKLMAAMKKGDDKTVRSEMTTVVRDGEGKVVQRLTERAIAIADAVGLE